MKYRVLVDDVFCSTDQSRQYAKGEYSSHAEALAVCREIVDSSLRYECAPGMPASALYVRYMIFGKDPFIVGDSESPDTSPGFSALDYAKARCEDLCSRHAEMNGQHIAKRPDIEGLRPPSS
jgi:hypothetical protein